MLKPEAKIYWIHRLAKKDLRKPIDPVTLVGPYCTADHLLDAMMRGFARDALERKF